MPVGIGVGSRHSTNGVFLFLAMAGVLLVTSAPHAAGQAALPSAQKRPLGREVPVYDPASGDPARTMRPAVDEPTGELTLRQAVALALLHNPGLAAFAWETRAREAHLLQVGRRPNPALSILAEDIGVSRQSGAASDAFVQPQTTIQLSQLIELGGKRAARLQLASLDRDLAAWDYESARMNVLTEVSRAFTDVLAAQETVALTAETTRLLEQVQQSVGLRVVSGVVSPIEETRATVALATVRVESARALRMLESARARLALLWGSATPTFTSAAGDLKSEPAPLPRFADLAAHITRSPEIERWTTEVSQREAALALERSKGVADVSVVAGYRRFADIGSNALLVGASIPLPLFDKYRDAVEAARIRVAKAHEDRRAAETRVAAMLATAYAALASAHDEVTALRTAVLPGSQQTFEAVSEGYRLGRFGYLDVLDAQRTLVGAGSQYLRALAEYRKAIADVERLIGAPLTDGAAGPSVSKE